MKNMDSCTVLDTTRTSTLASAGVDSNTRDRSFRSRDLQDKLRELRGSRRPSGVCREPL